MPRGSHPNSLKALKRINEQRMKARRILVPRRRYRQCGQGHEEALEVAKQVGKEVWNQVGAPVSTGLKSILNMFISSGGTHVAEKLNILPQDAPLNNAVMDAVNQYRQSGENDKATWMMLCYNILVRGGGYIIEILQAILSWLGEQWNDLTRRPLTKYNYEGELTYSDWETNRKGVSIHSDQRAGSVQLWFEWFDMAIREILGLLRENKAVGFFVFFVVMYILFKTDWLSAPFRFAKRTITATIRIPMQKMTQYHLPTIVLKRLLGLAERREEHREAIQPPVQTEVITAPPTEHVSSTTLRQRIPETMPVDAPLPRGVIPQSETTGQMEKPEEEEEEEDPWKMLYDEMKK